MNKIDYNSIRIPEEIELSKKLFEVIQSQAILKLAKEAQHPILQQDKDIFDEIDSKCFRVEKNTSPRYYRLFNEVLEALDFKEPIRFYVQADSTPNAFSVLSQGNHPHIVVVHSATLQIMKEDEIKQIIGHEIGHIIIRQGTLFPVLSVLSEQIDNNPSLNHKVRLWQQLSELSADRFGFMAAPDLLVRISSGIKFSSGLPLENLLDDYDIDYELFMEKAKNAVSYFKKNYGVSTEAHPMESIRLVALELFSKSSRFQPKGLTDQDLTKKTSNLLKVLYNIAENEMELNRAKFHASAGLIIASADGKINNDELDYIYDKISKYQIFPKDFFKAIAKQDYIAIFEQSVNQIIAEDPNNWQLREKILNNLIQISFSDKNVHPKEIDTILDIAEKQLKFSRKQASLLYLEAIHKHFMPNSENVF